METWAREHDFVRSPVTPADADGRFELDVPVARGMFVCASAPGSRSASAEIPWVAPADPFVEILLTTESFVSGTLTDSNGNPLRNALVLVWSVSRRVGVSPPTPTERVRGVTVTWKTSGGTSISALRTDGLTDAEGRFQIRRAGDGETRIVAYADGHRPVRWVGTPDAGTISGLALAAERADTSDRLVLLCGTTPLATGSALLSELCVDAPSPNTSHIPIAADGSIPTAWFETGRTYALWIHSDQLPRRRAAGRLVWNGRRTLDVTRLSPSTAITD